jgi:hypothetical protein
MVRTQGLFFFYMLSSSGKKGQTRRELVTSESKNRYFYTKKQRGEGGITRSGKRKRGSRE